MATDRDTAPPLDLLNSAKEAVKDTIGPLAVLTLGAQAYTSALSKSVLEARALQSALTASAGAEALRRQFQQLGLSAGAAKSQVEQLARLASTSSFSFSSLGTAAKNLQSIGGASVNTAANMRKVMDVAAATGAPVENVSEALASLYDRLKRGGDGAAAAAQELARMGAISQDTAAQIARFTAAGANSSASLKVLETDLGKAKGASVELSTTLIGLNRQLDGMKEGSDAKIGAMFDEGAKAGLRAQIAFEKVRDVMRETAAEKIAPVVGAVNSVKEGSGNVVSSGPALGATKSLTGGAYNLVAGATVATSVGLVQFLKGAITGTGSTWGKAKEIATPIMKRVGSAAGKIDKSLLDNEGAAGSIYRGLSRAVETAFSSGAGEEAAAAAATKKGIGSVIARWFTSLPRAVAGSFTGWVAGATAVAAYGSALYSQWQNQTHERETARDDSVEWGNQSSLQTSKNLKDSRSGSPVLTAAAMAAQQEQNSAEAEAIATKKQEVEEAKKKYAAHWQGRIGSASLDKFGNETPSGIGLDEIFTGRRADYNSLTYKQQQLAEMQQQHGNSVKALDLIGKRSSSLTGTLNSLQKNAMDFSLDGMGARDSQTAAIVNTLRVQQHFAPDTKARLAFKGQADDLEDKMSLRNRAMELTNQFGKDHAAEAFSIASAEVQRSRIMTNAEQAGTPQMSNLARMGGSAGFAGVVGGPDSKALDQISKLNETISSDLKRLVSEIQNAKKDSDRNMKEAMRK